MELLTLGMKLVVFLTSEQFQFALQHYDWANRTPFSAWFEGRSETAETSLLMKSVGGEGFLSLPAFGKFIHDHDIFLWHFICLKPNTFLLWTTCHISFNHAKTPCCLKIATNYCKKMNKLQLLHLATACAQKPMPNNGSVSSLVSSFQNTKGVLLIAVGVGNSQKCESTDVFAVPHPLRGRKTCKNWRDTADYSTFHSMKFFPIFVYAFHNCSKKSGWDGLK